MQRFYPDYEAIDAFTLSLDYHRNELACLHCSKRNQFVSHGTIYKQRSIDEVDKVGKRIFCSNRYGRTGCGRTFQLYVANEVPSYHYNATQIFIFITALLARLSVREAYKKATASSSEPRNAWRWLNRLMSRLTDYRRFLNLQPDARPIKSRHRRWRLLLPTLAQLFVDPLHNFCASWQLTHQRPFMTFPG